MFYRSVGPNKSVFYTQSATSGVFQIHAPSVGLGLKLIIQIQSYQSLILLTFYDIFGYLSYVLCKYEE